MKHSHTLTVMGARVLVEFTIDGSFIPANIHQPFEMPEAIVTKLYCGNEDITAWPLEGSAIMEEIESQLGELMRELLNV